MKDWILTIGIDKYYLTEQQKNFYLKAIETGAKFVRLDDNQIYGCSFQSLVHKNITKGLWQCEFNNWHSREAECFCNAEYKQLPNGSLQIVRNKSQITKI